jgi:hypothetical protein
LRTGIARIGLIFKKQMLIPLPNVQFFGGKSYPLVTILCENRTWGCHKIMIHAQHWIFGPNQLIFLPEQVPCRFSLNLPFFGLGPLYIGLGTNLKLLTNEIA